MRIGKRARIPTVGEDGDLRLLPANDIPQIESLADLIPSALETYERALNGPGVPWTVRIQVASSVLEAAGTGVATAKKSIIFEPADIAEHVPGGRVAG